MNERKEMKTKNTKVKKRGRPRSELRNWYHDNLPKLKPSKVNSEVVTEVDVYVPSIKSEVAIEVPKGYMVIPGEFTDGKSQATVGQTARNEARDLEIEDKRFIVHEIEAVVEEGRGKTKKTYDIRLFAVETTEA
jgi:hypothetical protein